MKKEKKNHQKEILEYLGRNYKFVHNELTGQLLYKRRNSKKDFKLFDRAYFYRLFMSAKKEYGESTIRHALKSIFHTPKNDVRAFCLSPAYSSENKKETSPFDALDDYFELKDSTPFGFGEMLEAHLVRAVRSVLNGKPNRFIFTLVSKGQYVGKTYFIEWLFPSDLRDYCMSTLSGRKEKRDTILASKFLVNIDEFSGATKSADAQLKALVSQKSASLWVPFKNHIEQRPRITTFFATKNIGKEPILSPHDANTRYIIYNLESIDWSYKKDVNVDDLWAYAIAKAHDESYDAELSIEDVRKLERYNKKFSKPFKRAKARPKRAKSIAIGAVIGSVVTALFASPIGRLIIASLARMAG